ncbi:rho-related GTP-binding protein RhoE isoform X2 [Zonotrichia albicollis]|uniref:rho-related GTP-binding protein RhoE isoform X2 n=1 Tax=Zonotrichia albicollis TaxID=44394 RepID=UPI003D80C494
MKERRASQKLSSKAVMDPNQNVKCKIVVVGDSQCGKTALLHVFAKDCFPESYVPTVFENYTASFEIDTQRIELSLWDTSGSPYYDNVRPLSYPDSDAVLICFDISRPETLDSVLKKWKGEIQEFCPNTKMLLVGCKSDLRTDVSTLVELSNHRQTPVSYDQVGATTSSAVPLCRKPLRFSQGPLENRMLTQCGISGSESWDAGPPRLLLGGPGLLECC